MIEVTVVIPTIPGREELLQRAIASVREDGVRPIFHIQTDAAGEGAAATRNHALKHGVETNLVAFLDDDDEFKPNHLTNCYQYAIYSGSDIVYPWFDINKGGQIRNDLDPLMVYGNPAFGQTFNPEALSQNNFIPITVLARTDLLREVGGFPVPGSADWPHVDCEDWGMWLRLREIEARFSHLPERTWTWHWHGKNTSGRSDQAAKIYG